jgi:hypothetical protein
LPSAAEQAEADDVLEGAVEGQHGDVGVELVQSAGEHLRLGQTMITFAEEDGARQVGDLNGVLIDDDGEAHAHQGEVLADLVAQGAGADDQRDGAAQLIEAPDVAQGQGEAAVARAVGDGEGVGHGGARQGADGGRDAVRPPR